MEPFRAGGKIPGEAEASEEFFVVGQQLLDLVDGSPANRSMMGV
jgi:hypothetical protein